tara:strand:- start:256 stop:1095 length:840 start_codon:yes stop_codon:yes gene_type:complete
MIGKGFLKIPMTKDAVILTTTYGEPLTEIYTFAKKVIQNCKDINHKYGVSLVIIFEKSELNKAQDLQKKLSKEDLQDFSEIFINNLGSGFCSCLNYGIKNSKSKYIIRLDTDDLLITNRLDLQLSKMIKEDLDLTYGDMRSEKGKLIKYPRNIFQIYLTLGLGANPIPHPTVCIRRNSFNTRLLYYNEQLEKAEDIELWIRCLMNPLFKFRHIGSPLTIYGNERSYLKNNDNAIAQIKIRTKYLKSIFFILIPLFTGLIFNIIRFVFKTGAFIKIRRKF